MRAGECLSDAASADSLFPTRREVASGILQPAGQEPPNGIGNAFIETAAAPAKQSICPDTIDRRRAAYVAEIDRIRALQSGSNDILEKADSLLTAHWAHASWTSRAAILRSVDWLLRIAIHHRAPARGVRTTMAAPYAARP